MRMVCFALMLSATAAHCQSGGIITQDGISISSGALVDSFDSSDPNHSIWQSNAVYRANYFSPGIHYGIWSNTLSFVSNSYPSRTANVAVFTDSNVLSLVGTIEVAGYVETGPNGAESIGAQASVGDLAWCFGANGSGGTTGLQPGHWIQNANRNFSSYPLPAFQNTWQSNNWLPIPTPTNVINIGGIWWYTNNAWTVVGGTLYTNYGSGYTIGGVTYSQVITNRLENTNYVYYSMGQLAQNLFVDAQYVVLYLTNGWNYGNQVFTLNTNADITVYSTGNIKAVANSVVNNLGNYTHAFSLYDVAGYPIAVELGGNAMAVGDYFVPSSTFKLDGGGGNGDFVGSIFCYSFSDIHHVNVHFDESLTNLQPITVQPSNLQPTLYGYLFSSKNWFICHLVGVTGLDYTIEASTNLVDWVPVCTNTSPFVFTETNPGLYPQRFYRSVNVP